MVGLGLVLVVLVLVVLVLVLVSWPMYLVGSVFALGSIPFLIPRFLF